MQYKSILTPNFSVFCVEMQEAIEDGFKLDFDNLPHASFTYYEAVLIKDDEMHDAESVALFAGIHASKEFTGDAAHEAFAGIQAPVKRVGRPAKAV